MKRPRRQLRTAAAHGIPREVFRDCVNGTRTEQTCTFYIWFGDFGGYIYLTQLFHHRCSR